MSVYKKVQLPNKVMTLSAAKQSCEGDISVVTDDGLYVLKPRVLADQVSADPIVHVARIPPVTEVYEFAVGIKHDAIQKEIQEAGEIHGDFLEVMLNRTLSPQIESLQANRGFVMAKWSPEGADIVGRPVLAGLTCDHRLDIISRQGTDRHWERVVSISGMYQDLMQKRGFAPAEERCRQHKDGGMKIITKLKERTYLLAGVAMLWSPVFSEYVSRQNIDREPASKKAKVDNPEHDTDKECCRYSYLIQASKSGHISLWKVNFPVRSKADVSFIDVVALYTKQTNAMCWCSVKNSSALSGVVVVGYNDGVLKLLALKPTEEGAGICQEVTVFGDVDNIRINALCWDESRNILFVGKGPYLFALVLDIDINGKTVNVTKQTHLAISTRLAVNEISLTREYISVGASDDIIALIKCETDPDLTLKKISDVKTPHDISGRHNPWRNHGVLWTRNSVFTIILCSPGWNYCHLEHRKPLTVHFVSQMSTEEVAADLLSARPESLMSDFTDSLAYIKQICYSDIDSLPSSLDQLVTQEAAWPSLTYFQIKLLRNLLKFRIYRLKADERTAIEEKIKQVEVLIRARWIDIVLKKIADNLTTLSITSPKQLQCLSLICDWVKSNGNEEEKGLMKKIRTKYPTSTSEICAVCEEEVKLTSLTQDACSNGHCFGRCSHSLLLCQEVPYRLCEECGAVATRKDMQAMPLPEPFLEDTCPICDHKLMLP